MTAVKGALTTPFALRNRRQYKHGVWPLNNAPAPISEQPTSQEQHHLTSLSHAIVASAQQRLQQAGTSKSKLA
jgi:hypothetical protein